MFVNRDRELKFLEHRYATNTAELVILYGRRRVGKTELLRIFCQGKPHLFFVADLGTEESLLAEFTRQISAWVYDDAAAISPFVSWEAAFNFLVAQASQQRFIVVLDEFTYLISANAALPSLLQKLWDTRLQATNLMLILCGSYISMMEQEVLAYRSPLYGRRTGQWRLQPFTFWDAQKLLPQLTSEDMVRTYAILGGVPAYLRRFDDEVTLLTNIEQNILTTGEFLYDEPRFLLLQELRDPSRYFAILEAIAGGHTRLNEIAQSSGINFTPQRVGNWWDRHAEIDLVAVGVDALLLGECKWSAKPLGTNILEDLKAKSHKVKQRQAGQQLHYALFARSGFTPALEQQAQQENVLLVDLNRLMTI